ncbi:MAG: DNA-binding protein [Dehalococcoidia bacterium]
MKYSQGTIGRTFVIRLEDGDRLPDIIEEFAAEHGILRGTCLMIGGIDSGGTLVVGPEDSTARPPIPIQFELEGAHEVAGIGTIFPNEEGKPILHMHAALGREGRTHTGCIRLGVEAWLVTEVILLEILDNEARRLIDEESGFELLEP